MKENNTLEKQRDNSLRQLIGALIIAVGVILLIGSGEPLPEDPSILYPTFKSIGFGLLVIFIGAIIFGFKKMIHKIKKALKDKT